MITLCYRRVIWEFADLRRTGQEGNVKSQRRGPRELIPTTDDNSFCGLLLLGLEGVWTEVLGVWDIVCGEWWGVFSPIPAIQGISFRGILIARLSWLVYFSSLCWSIRPVLNSLS